MAETNKEWSATMNNEIVVDAKICSGKPIIRGTMMRTSRTDACIR
jgi:uncharacterized protein (DUF433 family)